MSSIDAVRSREDLVPMACRIAEVVGAHAVICATDDGVLPRRLAQEVPDLRIIAATHDARTRAALEADGIEVVTVATQVADKYRQARLAAGSVLASGAVSEGELVVCVVGHGTSLGGGDLVVVTDLDDSSQLRGVGDLVRLGDDISPAVFESVMAIATRVGRVASRGKRIGALFVVGDSDRVREGSRQLVLNPLRGHDADDRRVTNPDLHDTLVELAKLDGAFVLTGDGLIQTGGLYLASSDTQVDVPNGLGTRHVAAAAVTARTNATAVVVSATDGGVRVFTNGRMVLQRHTDPALD
ncbi:diadenylate cyclase [Salsipaludibacter albus]|uniref:diadenylate cyclase n=1 Tax=Salsipaludibacter albus TaxID=2849650 RepID=UPI001EE4226E